MKWETIKTIKGEKKGELNKGDKKGEMMGSKKWGKLKQGKKMGDEMGEKYKLK